MFVNIFLEEVFRFMNEKELYELWCKKATDDKDLQDELLAIKDDEEAIKDRFYRDLEFGTGGLRGVIGAGSYRMNIYTVRRKRCNRLRQPYKVRCFRKSGCIRTCR